MHWREKKEPSKESTHGMSEVVIRNIEALMERRQADERAKGFKERLADSITAFTGSMTFVYIHLVLVGLWILINEEMLPFIQPLTLPMWFWPVPPQWRRSFFPPLSSSAKTGCRRSPTGARS